MSLNKKPKVSVQCRILHSYSTINAINQFYSRYTVVHHFCILFFLFFLAGVAFIFYFFLLFAGIVLGALSGKLVNFTRSL